MAFEKTDEGFEIRINGERQASEISIDLLSMKNDIVKVFHGKKRNKSLTLPGGLRLPGSFRRAGGLHWLRLPRRIHQGDGDLPRSHADREVALRANDGSG